MNTDYLYADFPKWKRKMEKSWKSQSSLNMDTTSSPQKSTSIIESSTPPATPISLKRIRKKPDSYSPKEKLSNRTKAAGFQKEKKKKKAWRCPFCSLKYDVKKYLRRHLSTQHPNGDPQLCARGNGITDKIKPITPAAPPVSQLHELYTSASSSGGETVVLSNSCMCNICQPALHLVNPETGEVCGCSNCQPGGVLEFAPCRFTKFNLNDMTQMIGSINN
jgi:hypothetical protein